ncbi:MAG: phenylacetate-CoA oxygenase/reductase subunit PaaK [Burkholderiales bacterium]|nr:phenylacetate-CoA oxygenase/reductase subunit PaaK [Burkholderiales bacterium]MDE1925726.1 phenylacetate-CoA oxygenase/reductase subunit PaaK [Burkholderiales bacterium]MDE2157865.1 phenylacetate-CoA oxygenase/reductase subunit PaaK [Burkholderiales bacterium]MDE2502562.1 phenylacetate-CoA oxygenase/reductase subunit PaaK [Burkholderiales bacterium]
MSKFHPLTVARVHRETRDAIVVTFDVPADLRPQYAYDAGQHLTLRARVDGEDLRRSYSICSAVQDAQLRVAIKRCADGRFSNWANDHLAPGATIDVMPPAGHFALPPDAQSARRYLAFAAGSGITPIRSIVETTLRAEPHSSFTLVYGNRSSAAVIFREELAELKDRYPGRLNLVHVLSREHQDIELFNGRITREKCEALFAQWITVADHDAAYVCGPESMMREVTAALEAQGMPRTAIKVELFAASIPQQAHVPGARPRVGQSECEVTLVIDGSQRHYTMAKDRESVLDAGLAQGIDIRYSCKGGVCSTCRCKVVEGKVEMDANYALEDYEIARGFVLSCQSFPVTDRVVLDFDTDH